MRFAPLWLLAIVLSMSTGFAGRADAEIFITKKHLIILRQGVDSVMGSYVFAVQNTGTDKVKFKSRVMLPKETEDFVPQEGVEATELALASPAEGGGVVIDKEFPSGVQIISIGFKVGANYGRSVLTLTPVSEIESFTVLVPRASGLKINSTVLAPGEMGSAPDPQYEAYLSNAVLGVGTPFAVEVTGLPEGRRRIWIVGGGVAFLLAVLSGILAARTRPKISGAAGETVLTA